MAFAFFVSAALFLSLCPLVKCDALLPQGVLYMECHDRYLMIAVERSFTGTEPRFEAVDGAGVYPITEEYAAKCGYTVHFPGHVELRASYFSCQTENKDNKEFTFNFNLVVANEGEEVSYALNKTCAPALPWSPREVTCELNYMEVSVKSEISCPSGPMDDWNAVKPALDSTTSDWQVMFQKEGDSAVPMSLSEARKLGYMFDLASGRLVFRAAYGKPHAFNTTVGGVAVQVLHATLFSRQNWVVIMVDLVAACSMHEGSYDESGYVFLETPEVLYPNLDIAHFHMGLNGELVELPVAEEQGFIVVTHNNTVQISIPYNIEGGYRKSAVNGDLYEFHTFHLYLEQILADEDQVQTRIRSHRTLVTPLLLRTIFVENCTVLEDHVFTVHLGDIPEDVELSAVELNGERFAVPFTNETTHAVEKVLQSNNTHGYTLTVMFDDPVVVIEYLKAEGLVQHSLDINYTLTVLPENESFYHFTSLMAATELVPPEFDAVCSESGITFRLDHQHHDYLWYFSISYEDLTPELAAQRGYIMRNDSQSLRLEVPLFTQGYEYKDWSLKGFSGTFEILVHDNETSEVVSSSSKTCQFKTNELIVCSTDGRMTVVVDLALAVHAGGSASRANLMDVYCGPKEVDGTRALFSFPINSCGSIVKVHKENVTYDNEIFISQRANAVSDAPAERVKVQCLYRLDELHRLFSVHRFDSDNPGIGSITHTPYTAEDVTPRPTLGTKRPTRRPLRRPAAPKVQTTPTTTTTTTKTVTKPAKRAFPQSVVYVKVSKAHKFRADKVTGHANTNVKNSHAFSWA